MTKVRTGKTMKGKAPDGLEVLIVHVDRLHPNPWNPNRQDERTYHAERESIRSYGFIDPCTARPHPTRGKKLVSLGGTGVSDTDWQTIDGEHRWRAAKDEGYDHVSVIPLRLDDNAARKLTIILNETRGEADVALLGKLLHELQQDVPDVDELLTGLPYTSSELENLVNLGPVDWDQFAPQGPKPGANGKDGLVTVAFDMTAAQADAMPNLALMLQREWEQPNPGAAVFEAVSRACKEL